MKKQPGNSELGVQEVSALLKNLDANEVSHKDLIKFMVRASFIKEGVNHKNILTGYVELCKMLKERKDYINLLKCVRQMCRFQEMTFDLSSFDSNSTINEIFGISIKDMEDIQAYVLDYLPSFRKAKFEGRLETEHNLKSFYEKMKEPLMQEKSLSEDDKEFLTGPLFGETSRNISDGDPK